MRYRIVFMAALAAALLLTGCGQTAVSSAGPARSEPAASASEPVPSPDPGQSEPAASASGPASSSDPGQSEPAASASEPAPSPDPGQSEPAASGPSPASGIPEEPPQTPAGSGTTAGEERFLAACDSADWSWFDDAVFIGDSVSVQLQNYVVAQRRNDPGFFGGAQFLTSISLGSGNALWQVSDQSVHPVYQGEKMRLEQSVPLTGAKKVYMMLGINDVALYGIDGAVKNYGQLMDLILENAPYVEFYIQSATPICRSGEVGSLTNENLARYNDALKRMCQERGVRFVDVARALKDADGCLPLEYCSDPDGMGIHMTGLACRVWLGYLAMDARG